MNPKNLPIAASSHSPQDLSRLISFTTSRVGQLVACLLMMLGITLLPQITSAATVATPVTVTPDYPYNTNHILGGEVMIVRATVSNPTNTLSYLWQIEHPDQVDVWFDVSGATATNINLSPTDTIDLQNLYGNFRYHLLVTDGANIVTSAPVSIVIDPGLVPTLVGDIAPSGTTTVYAGGYFTYTASFSGTRPIYYQWQKSTDGGGTWNPISGANSASYTVSGATPGDAGDYRLAATNIIGGVLGAGGDAVGVSSSATKVVSTGTPQFSWSTNIPFAGLTAEVILTNFPAADKIAGALVAQASVFGATVTLTNANNQQIVFAPLKLTSWGNVSGGTGFATGANTNATGNTDFNNVLNSFYTDGGSQTVTMNGLTVGQKYQVQLFSLDDRGAQKSRIVYWQDSEDVANYSVQYTEGSHSYIIGTFTASNNVETIKLNQVNNAGNFNALVLRTVGWNPPPYWVKQPSSAGGITGSTGKMNGLAGGDSTIPIPTITYKWVSGTGGSYTDLSNGNKYSGTTTATLTISNMAALDTTLDYVLIASNGGGSITSAPAKVLIHAPPEPGSYAALAFSNNPVAYYKLDETIDPSSGDVVAIDLTGNNRSGTYGSSSMNGFNGVLSPQPTNSDPSAVLYPGFGTNQGAWQNSSGGSSIPSIVTLPMLNMDTNIVDTTIAMWIKPTAQPGYAAGLFYSRSGSGQSDNGPNNVGFGFGGNGIGGGAAATRALGYIWTGDVGGSTYAYNAPFGPPRGIWSFVALVVQTNQATFYCYYIDTNTMQPVLLSAVNAVTHTAGPWNGTVNQIGADSWGGYGGRVFPGDISEVGFFQKALSPDKILELFQGGTKIAGAKPTITMQPASRVAYAGTAASLSVGGINGTSPLGGYQWQHYGTNLIGENTDTFNIASTTVADSGPYQFIVTNMFGATTSSVANISIIGIPGTNLVGHWFAGGETMDDVSGYKPPHTHDGYLVVGSDYYYTNDVPPGHTGSSIRLNGGTSIGIMNSSTNDAGYLDTFDGTTTNSFTVMCWAKGWPAGWSPWVSKEGESVGWQLRVDGNNTSYVCFTIRGAGGTIQLGTAVFGNAEDMSGRTVPAIGSANTAWHHYAGTFDGVTGIRELYVDGVLAAREINNHSARPANGARLVIGGRSNTAGTTVGSQYTGQIYDVRIYDAIQYLPAIGTIGVLPPILTFVNTSAGGDLVISWGYGSLLESTNVFGPWTPVIGTSPYTNTINPATPQKYFRGQNP